MCSCPVVDNSQLEENPKVDCIYEKLINGDILPDFIDRYFAPSEPNQSFLGELNLTWTIGTTAEILPLGHQDNNTYYSVEIILNESALNTSSATNVALTMLHEALHAKLIAEVYDEVGSTDFKTLYAYYKGWGLNDLDKQQELEMLNLYFTDLAIGLKSFDDSQGIFNDLATYEKAIRYDLIYEIYKMSSSTDDYNAYLKLLVKST